jgi:hypothetical protein
LQTPQKNDNKKDAVPAFEARQQNTPPHTRAAKGVSYEKIITVAWHCHADYFYAHALRVQQ